jgi:hypothetical protein
VRTYIGPCSHIYSLEFDPLVHKKRLRIEQDMAKYILV